MKFGRAPTTERTRIALSSQLLDGEDRDRDRHDEADESDRVVGVAAARHDDAVTGAQAEPFDGHAARERVLEGVPLVQPLALPLDASARELRDRKSTRLNSSHGYISYAVFCLKKKKKTHRHATSL